MAIPLIELLDRVAPQTEAAVAQTRQRFNHVVRQLLRAETRLNLSSAVAGDESDERETRSVRVFVSPGVPEELESLRFEDRHWLAIELAPLKGLLDIAHDSIAELSGPIEQLMKRQEFEARFPGADSVVWGMRDLAAALLAEAAKFELLKRIFSINEDVLGRYSYRLHPQNAMFSEEQPSNVRADLYWGVIGLVSKMLGVTVEALTVTVLAHELAHAYTHIGADADGKRWDANDFFKTDLGVKEGLAQYYTARVLDRLERQIPEASQAYNKLLPHQPKVYSTHLSWLENFTPEEVRDAMLIVRRAGMGTVNEFQQALDAARKRLRK